MLMNAEKIRPVVKIASGGQITQRKYLIHPSIEIAPKTTRVKITPQTNP
jgi:hypothetical protein